MKKRIKKKTVVFLGLFLVFILCVVGGYFGYQSYLNRVKDEKIAEIKSHYGNFVRVLKNSKLYIKKDDKFEEIGAVHDDVVVPLEDVDIQKETDTKFLIHRTNYYVDYSQVVVDDGNVEMLSSHYLPLEKELVTRETTNLYQDGILKISLHETATFSILYGVGDYYRVSYLNHFFDIRKEEVDVRDEELDVKNTEADYISVVQFAKFDETCKSNACISKDKITEFVKEWQENHNYSITESEYLSWIQGDLKLTPGAMLITVTEREEEFQNILKENGFEIIEASQLTFVNNDSTTNKNTKKESVNRYVLHQNMSEEERKKVLEGKTIEKPKPVVTTKSKNPPSIDAKATQIAVLNYHFFYDPDAGEVCGDNNCMPVAQFREQLNYLRDNQYKTLTMEEYRAWMYNEIDLPARSVLITIDDGAMGTGKHNGNKLIPILEEYQMHATLFLITGWWSIENYRSPYLDIESHTFDMHTEGLCKNQTRGAKMLCSTKEQVLDDLRKSLSVTNSNKAFCFPFYAYNDMAIQSLKKVGFQMGFVGGYTKSNRNQDKYKITRYPVHRSTTLNQFINMIN